MPEPLNNFVAMPGVFAVSDTTKVKFAKGNLVYTVSTRSSFSFEANQYDYRATYSDEVWGLFGWSTSSTNYGMSTSTRSGDYSGDFKDWGTAIGDGNTWRTLSKDEWVYLFNTRAGARIGGNSNCRYADAIVAGVNGIILFPDAVGAANDSFTWPQGITAPTTYNPVVSNWNGASSYSAAQWATLETAGCVFLPAAGTRDGTIIRRAGSYGYYWSSTPYGTSLAYSLSFSGEGVNPQNYSFREPGYSVRLVQNAN